MRRFSQDQAGIAASYDAIVIGSGYGGGIAASRLARMGLKVCVLERGREFVAGEFPDTLPEAQREMQISGPEGHVGRHLGLYDFRMGKDIHVIQACGLGGTSLINANVSLPPDPRVWEDPVWPPELIGDGLIEEGFQRAARMLRPKPYPADRRLMKLDRIEEASAGLGHAAKRLPINVVTEAGANYANVHQPACTDCGDCCSGCNVGAKTTVNVTYIADAVNHGADVFTEAHVDVVRKEADGTWRVLYRAVEEGKDVFKAPQRSIAAEIVVVAAGSLGSTEILLRSKAAGLAISDQVGKRFTGNGDVLAFAYNTKNPVNAIGVGEPPKVPGPRPGPCITGAVDMRDAEAFEEGFILEEGVIPRGLHSVLPGLFGHGAGVFGSRTDQSVAARAGQVARRIGSGLLGSYEGAIHHTQTYLVMAHDGTGGEMKLGRDLKGRERLEIAWPQVAREAMFKRVSAAIEKATAAMGGTYIKNPLQTTFLGETVVTVHPLGGCSMGASRASGVVDHKCRVFDAAGAAPDAVHEGLYVTCGAALPRSVGVNPLLTISAVAERAMIHLARDIQLEFTDAPKADAPQRSAAPLGAARAHSLAVVETASAATGVAFTERMAGFMHPVAQAPGRDLEAYLDSGHAGRAAHSVFDFIGTINVGDIERFVDDPAHTGTIAGAVKAPALSAEPLDISEGIFNLMQVDHERVRTRRFDYKALLSSREGKRYRFAGFKVVHDDKAGLDLWSDTSTLYIDVVEEATGSAVPKRFAGVIHIDPVDFGKQLTTLAAIGGGSSAKRAAAVAKFGALFAGTLYDVYGHAPGLAAKALASAEGGKPAAPGGGLAEADLAGRELVEEHGGTAIFRLKDGRYQVVSRLTVPSLEAARAAARAPR